MEYQEIVARRDALDPGRFSDTFGTLREADWHRDWVTPIQQSSRDPTGPVVMGSHWADIETARQHRQRQAREWYGGYLPGKPFNRVLDLALWLAKLHRMDIYVTQACHFLPRDQRRQRVPRELWRLSYDEVTQYELRGRPVVALGRPARLLCEHYGLWHRAFRHPGTGGSSFQSQAEAVAEALGEFKRSARPSGGRIP